MKMNSRAILLCLMLGLSVRAFGKTTNNSPAKLSVEERALNRDVRAPISFAPVIKRVAPSVVTIYSSMTIHEKGSQNPFGDDPFLRRFFGDQFGQMQPRDRKAQGLGS